MKIKIEEIYSRTMFPGLMMGKPKDGMYEKSLEGIMKLLPDYNPIINVSEVKWVNFYGDDGKHLGHGSWGHITGVGIEISEGDDRYSFSVIFNFVPEIEKLEDKIQVVLDQIDWRSQSVKWDIGDL
jgi:hypothetical protein